MGRRRKITANDILDAVERVVLSFGAAGIWIDAVAKEAGVSKSRVLYDHRSKSTLLEALVDRHLNAEKVRIRKAVAECGDTPHPELFGRIAVAEPTLSDADRAVAMAISVAMINEKRLQSKVSAWSDEEEKLIGNTDRPMAATIAHLALLGFYWKELSDAHVADPGERRLILDGIRAIFTSFPESDHPRTVSADTESKQKVSL